MSFGKGSISIIIPTFNEAACLKGTLGNLATMESLGEVIVVDGGSGDDTAAIAARCGARVIVSERGRGLQMHQGAQRAQGRVLWFLHADTRPCAGAGQEILRCFEDPSVVGGHFRVAFDGGSSAARFLTWLYPQLRRLGLCYGDSAFFVERNAYERSGGFRPFPIFEDLDLLRRLRRQGRFVRLPATVTTSSRRFEGRSFCLTFAKWTLLQVLYWAGCSPERLGRSYAPIRSGSRQKPPR